MILNLDKKINYLKNNGVEPEFFITKTKMVKLCMDDSGIHCFIFYRHPEWFHFDNQKEDFWPMINRDFEVEYEELQEQFVPKIICPVETCIEQLIQYQKFLNDFGYTSCNINIDYDSFIVTAIRSETEFEFCGRLIDKIKEVKSKKISETKKRKKENVERKTKKSNPGP